MSGTSSRSEVGGDKAATADVSQTLSSIGLSKYPNKTFSLPAYLALYEADRKAHEEAVQNGGVSHLLLHLMRSSMLTHNFAISSSCIGTAHPTRRVTILPPVFGNPVATPSLPTLVPTTSLPPGSPRPRSRVTPSSDMSSERLKGSQALL